MDTFAGIVEQEGCSSSSTSAYYRGAELDKVLQVYNVKEMRDVYVPIQLSNRKAVALLDTGCDTSIIGARFLIMFGSMEARRLKRKQVYNM